jgi:hypothetical protein
MIILLTIVPQSLTSYVRLWYLHFIIPYYLFAAVLEKVLLARLTAVTSTVYIVPDTTPWALAPFW